MQISNVMHWFSVPTLADLLRQHGPWFSSLCSSVSSQPECFNMATFELVNDKYLNTQSNFQFHNSRKRAHTHTHTLWSDWGGGELNRGRALLCVQYQTWSIQYCHWHTLTWLTEWCWAQGSAWGQTGLKAHWRTFFPDQDKFHNIRFGI